MQTPPCRQPPGMAARAAKDRVRSCRAWAVGRAVSTASSLGSSSPASTALMSPAYCPARPASRPATAAAVPPASRSAGRNWPGRCWPCQGCPIAPCSSGLPRGAHWAPLAELIGPPSRSSLGLPRGRFTAVEREAHPAPLVMGEFHGVDHLLHPQSVVEVTLVPGEFAEHLAGEVRAEVGVVEGPPRLPRGPARRLVGRPELDLAELHLVGRGDVQCLTDAAFLDQPGDRGTLAAV